MLAPSIPSEAQENAARFIWTAAIVGFFVLQAILWTVAITLTHRDSSHAIVEDYDDRALHWDEYQLLRQASAELGWTSAIDVSPDGDLHSRHRLSLSLSEREFSPVSNATVQVRMFHLARAGEPELIELKESEPGLYFGVATIRSGGNWQFEIAASRGADSFIETIRRNISIDKARSK